ncbi:pilus assembly protein PilM [bacterium]|nr:pilus assembly protein PilM [bacterium]
MNRTKSFQIQTSSTWPFVLGMDISTSSLKYVVIRNSRTGMRIEGYGRHEIDPHEQAGFEKIRKIISELFHKKSPLRKARIVLGIEGSGVIIKKESFPSLGKKELAQTIFFAIQQELGNELEAGAASVDFIELGPDPARDDHTNYLCMGMAESLIEDRMAPLAMEHIVPNKVIPSVATLINLIPLLPPVYKNKPIGFLDIGANRSMLVFIKDGHLHFHREIVVGGDDFTKAITGTIFHEGEAIQFNHAEADEFKRRFGYPMGFNESVTFHGAPLDEVGTMIRPVVERLIGEIQRSLDFYREKFQDENIEEIFLIGGGSRTRHLTEALSDKIDIPITLFPLPPKLRVSGNKKQQEEFDHRFLEQATALGLALEISSKGNLLPVVYKKANQMAVVKRAIQLAALAILTIMTIWSFSLSSALVKRRQDVTRLENKVTLSTRNTGFLYAALQQKKKSNLNLITDLQKRMQSDERATEILKMISRNMPKKLALTNIDIGARKKVVSQGRQDEDEKAEIESRIVKIAGWTPKPANDVGVILAQFIVDLEKSGYFSKVSLERQFFSEEDKEFRFSIICSMR